MELMTKTHRCHVDKILHGHILLSICCTFFTDKKPQLILSAFTSPEILYKKKTKFLILIILIGFNIKIIEKTKYLLIT